jgi:hypothetical protein
MRSICSIPGCGRFCKGHSFCNLHYQRWKAHGNPNTVLIAADGEPMAWILAHCETTSQECLTWPFGRIPRGNSIIKAGGRTQIASRVMCEIIHGAPPTPGHEAAHSCGKGHEACMNPNHLRWATPSENAADRILHGTANRGIRNGSARLSDGDVALIRSMNGSSRVLGRRFGIDPRQISRIRRREAWGHVP